MCKRFRYALVGITFFCGVLNLSAQNPPCPAGTLANVLGTSCSVGSLTLNFQNNFFGQFIVAEIGVPINPVPISPTQIGFTPIIQGNQVGFKLTTNFVDGPASDSGSFSGRTVQFSYTPQANPGFDIVAEVVQIDASAQSSATDSASETVFDFQDYPNVFSTSPNPFIVDQNGTISSHLTDPVYLPTPALLSVGFANDPQNITTFLQGQTTGTAQATLKSATFLYSVGPVGPLPPAPLAYSALDLPGVASTLVSSITNSGKMVGTYEDAQGVFHAYVTREGDEFITIDFPNATATFGNGLNDRGDLVGSYTDADGNTHGFILQGGNLATIDFPGATLTEPIGINDRRQIVGFYETADQGTHGFLLDDGGFVSIDHSDPDANPFITGPAFTEILGINNGSEIAGFFFDPFTLRGLVQREDSSHAVDVPGQTPTFIEALNDEGTLLGNYGDLNGIQHGFVSRNELFRTVDFPGGNTTFPLGINAAGRIVGQYSDATGNFHSFLAEPHPGENSRADSAGVSTAGTIQSQAATQPAPRICGSAEWLRHPEQMRLSCKAASLNSSGSQQ